MMLGTKLVAVTQEIHRAVPEAEPLIRSVTNILYETARNALRDIHIQVPRIEAAPGAWDDKWSIFGHQLALGIQHCANLTYLVYGGIVLAGATEHLSQEVIEMLDKYRNFALVIGTEAIEANPPALLRH